PLRSSGGRTSSSSCGSAQRRDRRAVAAACPWSGPSERDVVVGAPCAEVCVLGLRRGTRGDELVLAALAVAPAAQELDALGHGFAGLPLRPVLGVPLTPLETPIDGNRATLRQVLGATLALVAPDSDVEVVRLLGPLARRTVLAPRVDGEPQAADGSS